MPTDLAAELARATANRRHAIDLCSQAQALCARAHQLRDRTYQILVDRPGVAPSVAAVAPDRLALVDPHDTVFEVVQTMVGILNQFPTADQIAIMKALTVRTLVIATYQVQAAPAPLTLSA